MVGKSILAQKESLANGQPNKLSSYHRMAQGDQLFFYENPQKFPKNTPISPIHKIKIPKLSPKSILNEKKIIYISILRPIRNFISLLSIEPFHN